MTDQPEKIITPPQPRRRAGTDVPMTLNDAGKWVIAIPEPATHALRKACPGTPGKTCPKAFWTMAGYRGHYALAHILGTP